MLFFFIFFWLIFWNFKDCLFFVCKFFLSKQIKKIVVKGKTNRTTISQQLFLVVVVFSVIRKKKKSNKFWWYLMSSAILYLLLQINLNLKIADITEEKKKTTYDWQIFLEKKIFFWYWVIDIDIYWLFFFPNQINLFKFIKNKP